jgi:hypothetical protein
VAFRPADQKSRRRRFLTLTSRRRFFAVAALFLPLLSRAAQTSTVKPHGVAREVWVRTELYFGTDKANGRVTEAEFDDFVNSHITRLFPDGLTLLRGYGQFKNSNGEIIREKSYLLILFYPPHTQSVNKKIEELRRIYKATHCQASVLRVDSFSFVSF